MNVNKAILIGNLTRDPELKSLPSGVKVCTFSLATNEVYTKDNKKVEKTEFHNIIAFGKTAENIAQYMHKGSQLYIEGKIQTRSWDDKTSGEKKYRTEILANIVQFGAKPAGQRDSNTERAPSKAKTDELSEFDNADDINPENIPF